MSPPRRTARAAPLPRATRAVWSPKNDFTNHDTYPYTPCRLSLAGGAEPRYILHLVLLVVLLVGVVDVVDAVGRLGLVIVVVLLAAPRAGVRAACGDCSSEWRAQRTSFLNE